MRIPKGTYGIKKMDLIFLFLSIPFSLPFFLLCPHRSHRYSFSSQLSSFYSFVPSFFFLQIPLGFFWYYNGYNNMSLAVYLSLFLTTELTCQVANSHLKMIFILNSGWLFTLTVKRNYIHVPRLIPTVEPTTPRLPFRDPFFATLETNSSFNDANRNPNYD